MKKAILPLCLIMLIFMLATGCKKAEKTDDDIRNIAYQYLSEGSRETIINWESAEVDKTTTPPAYSITHPKGIVITEGEDCYKVTFRTHNEAVVGPIDVFIDRNTYEIIGVSLRD